MQTQSVTEGIEAECMYEYGRSAPVQILGTAVARIGGGVAVSMRHDPTRYWSKALGFSGPITAANGSSWPPRSRTSRPRRTARCRSARSVTTTSTSRSGPVFCSTRSAWKRRDSRKCWQPPHGTRGSGRTRSGREAAAGCRLVVSETWSPDSGVNNPSLNNLRRAGLQPRYRRRNWIYSV